MTPARIDPLGEVRVRARVPGDKSISHRALILNALARGPARVSNLAPGADVASTAAALRALGARVDVEGGAAAIEGPARWAADAAIDCGNSGTTARLLLGVLAPRAEGRVTLAGDPSLSRRPMARVAAPLRAMGAAIEEGGNGPDRLPLVVRGRALEGARHRTPVASAQVKSALLLAGLAADGETAVLEPGESRDHTERMLAAMGVDLAVDPPLGAPAPAGRAVALRAGTPRPLDVDVPGDLSSAAFLLALAAARPGGEAVVEDVGLNPTRTGFLEILAAMGALVEIEPGADGFEPRGTVRVVGRGLRGIALDPALVPRAIDELPLVALLGAVAEGETTVAGASELRVKESDRVAAIAAGLRALGADVEPRADGFVARGPARLRGAALDAAGDHRIGMTLAVGAALADGPSALAGAEWIAVSWPGFLDVLARAGGGARAAARRGAA